MLKQPLKYTEEKFYEVKEYFGDDCLLESRFLKLHKQNNKWGPTNVKKGLQELARAFHVDLKEFM